MLAPLELLKTDAKNEWVFWKNAFIGALLLGLAAATGDLIESALFPVVEHVKLGEAKFMKAGRLCWSYEGVKVRNATGLTYAAQVYESDHAKPTHRELTHLDGTPYGGPRSGAPVGSFATQMCVCTDHIKGSYSRIGVRVVVEHQLDAWRPYLIRQGEIWRNYYPDRPETK